MSHSFLIRFQIALVIAIVAVLVYLIGYPIFAYILAVGCIVVFPVFKRKEVVVEQPTATASAPIITQGSVMVNGQPTNVLVLDNSFIEKVKGSERGKNSDTVVQKLHRSKFQLLS